MEDLGAVSTADYRCFDAAYEQLSGRLMVVAATAANTITYWTWDSGTWSSGSTYSFSNTMATIHWVKLAANPASNEITLVAAASDSVANALIWSGSAWGNESNLTSALPTTAQEAIGVEYIRAGSTMGQSAVFWGDGTYLYGKPWTGSGWGTPWGKSSSNVRWLRVKADPNSNKIAVGYETSNNDVYVRIWKETNWFSAANLITSDASGDFTYHRPFDRIFLTGPGTDGGTCLGSEYGYECIGDLLVVYSSPTDRSLYPLAYRTCELTTSSSMT